MGWLKINRGIVGCANQFEAPIKNACFSHVWKEISLQTPICREFLDYSCLSAILSILADVSKNLVWQRFFSWIYS